jgi:hypothetical protein
VSKKIVTIEFEVSAGDVSALEEMQRDGALGDLAECVATLKGRRVVNVIFSD